MKEKRLYSLFARRRGTKAWHRISRLAMTKSGAVRTFQNSLLRLSLETPFEPALRPVPADPIELSPDAEAIRREAFPGCSR